MSNKNIFGLVRETEIVAGIPLSKKGSLSPAESVWLEENTKQQRDKFNSDYLKFVALVKEKLELPTEEGAYHAVKKYYRGDLEDSRVADSIELLALKNPREIERGIEDQELTYLVNSRIVRELFPIKEFQECFGLEFKGQWTIEFTRAAEEIKDKLLEFFEKEINKEKKSIEKKAEQS